MGVGVNGCKRDDYRHSYYDTGDDVRKEMQGRLDAAKAEIAAMRRVNPDPSRWELIDDVSIGEYIVMRVKYPNCTNREGVKVMVYKATLSQLVRQKSLDPHFGESKDGYIYPIARFEPTEAGYADALEFASGKSKVPLAGTEKKVDDNWIPPEYQKKPSKKPVESVELAEV